MDSEQLHEEARRVIAMERARLTSLQSEVRAVAEEMRALGRGVSWVASEDLLPWASRLLAAVEGKE